MSETLQTKVNSDSVAHSEAGHALLPYHTPQMAVLGPIGTVVKHGNPGGGDDFTFVTKSEAS
jgi:hypothetical protein